MGHWGTSSVFVTAFADLAFGGGCGGGGGNRVVRVFIWSCGCSSGGGGVHRVVRVFIWW